MTAGNGTDQFSFSYDLPHDRSSGLTLEGLGVIINCPWHDHTYVDSSYWGSLNSTQPVIDRTLLCH